MRTLPTTRFYQIKPAKAGWARIWITDDGSISILSDWGNFGYWFGAPGCEFRKFLTRCDDDYLGNKFGGGRDEYDGEATRKAIQRVILSKRREQRLDHFAAREEWGLLKGDAVESLFELGAWQVRTALSPDDYFETPVYVVPNRVRQFLKHVWPLFVEQLKAELAAEAPVDA